MTLDESKAFAGWLFDRIGWFCFVVLLVTWGWNLSPFGRDSTDRQWPAYRSQMEPLVDAETGCEYLRTTGGGITPRLTAEGKQKCGKPRGEN